MTIGIIGLGLIGGSLAKAFAAATEHRLLGWDREARALDAALADGVIRGVLAPPDWAACDLLLVALPPRATLDQLRVVAPALRPDAVLMDACGVKRTICRAGFELARRHGFTFVGGHPMAGRACSGYAASQPSLFRGASLLLVADEHASDVRRSELDALFRAIGFGRVMFTTAEHHDRVVALTSQLAHVVSNAYVKSPRAAEHRGFSAGSFADLTRVAWLDENLWCELFLENRDNLAREIDGLTAELKAVRDALQDGDSERLIQLLKQGRECKELIG